MSALSGRYARALLEAAAKNALTDGLRAELEGFAELVRSDERLAGFMRDPGVSKAEKKELLHKLLEGRCHSKALAFLVLLTDKGRFGLLPEILKEYGILADRLAKVLRVRVISAMPLESGQLEALREKYRIEYGAAEVKLELETDAGLIGGLKVVIGDKVIDGSLKGRIQDLEMLLNEC